MFTAYFILTISAALFCFYFQCVCEKILRREFDREYFQPVVRANQLGFPQIRALLEPFDAPVQYIRFRTALKCDFLTLTYMLKSAAKRNRRYSAEDHLVIFYFRLMLFCLFVRHALRLGEKATILKLTTILQHLANVAGQRIGSLRFGDLLASEYIRNL